MSGSDGDSLSGSKCLSKWSKGLFHHYTFFSPRRNGSDVYAVKTPWYLTYPAAAAAALEEVGFLIHLENPVASCGWTLVDQVYSKGLFVAEALHQGVNNGDMGVVLNVRESLSDTFPTLEICLATILPFFVFFICCSGVCLLTLCRR